MELDQDYTYTHLNLGDGREKARTQDHICTLRIDLR
jgi:hypothetical protein